jgi:hypothetical protein
MRDAMVKPNGRPTQRTRPTPIFDAFLCLTIEGVNECVTVESIVLKKYRTC